MALQRPEARPARRGPRLRTAAIRPPAAHPGARPQEAQPERTGDTAALDYRDEGYLPDAMVNFLALLGWSLDDKTTIISREELLQHFSLERVVPNPAIFDLERLNYLNGQYIRALPDGRVGRTWCANGVSTASPSPSSAPWIAPWPMLQPRS
ncbi:MAG: glutamate--tRNA ligase family protein [Dehalococcoidia bacterium]|nr:glutamate--tRNA ligase family protein [Dehalococcoidia bacterium]